MKTQHRRFLVTLKKHVWKITGLFLLFLLVTLGAFAEFLKESVSWYFGFVSVCAIAYAWWTINAVIQYRHEREADRDRDRVNHAVQ